jgi:hypothetical protein
VQCSAVYDSSVQCSVDIDSTAVSIAPSAGKWEIPDNAPPIMRRRVRYTRHTWITQYNTAQSTIHPAHTRRTVQYNAEYDTAGTQYSAEYNTVQYSTIQPAHMERTVRYTAEYDTAGTHGAAQAVGRCLYVLIIFWLFLLAYSEFVGQNGPINTILKTSNNIF